MKVDHRVLSVMGVALMVGCATSHAPNQVSSVTLELVATDVEIIKRCGHSVFMSAPLGCAYKRGDSCTIVAYAPRSWDDRRRLETLGHELWHCFIGDPSHSQ